MNSTVAVITGGGQGLGRAFAENLLERNYRVSTLTNKCIANALIKTTIFSLFRMIHYFRFI